MAAVPSIGRATHVQRQPAAPEAEATRDLYERYHRQIFNYCMHQLGNRQEAEDAVQGTFLNAFRGFKRGITPEYESAWLFKIAENVCLTRRRASSRRGRVEWASDLQEFQDVVPGHSADGDGELMGLSEALSAMPEQQRTAILLREWQGLSYKEIAEEMSLTQGAVETLIFRARRTLANGLTEPEKQTKRRWRHALDVGSVLAGLKTFLGGSAAVKVAATVAVATTATTGTVVAKKATGDPTPAKPAMVVERGTPEAPAPAPVTSGAAVAPVQDAAATPDDRAGRPAKPADAAREKSATETRRAASPPAAAAIVSVPESAIPPAAPSPPPSEETVAVTPHPGQEQQTQAEPRSEHPKSEQPKAEQPKAEHPKSEQPKNERGGERGNVDHGKSELPRSEQPKAEKSRGEHGRPDEARTEQPAAEQSRGDHGKSEQTKGDHGKSEAPQSEQPKSDHGKPEKANEQPKSEVKTFGESKSDSGGSKSAGSSSDNAEKDVRREAKRDEQESRKEERSETQGAPAAQHAAQSAAPAVSPPPTPAPLSTTPAPEVRPDPAASRAEERKDERRDERKEERASEGGQGAGGGSNGQGQGKKK